MANSSFSLSPGGLLEVQPHLVTVLSDTAMRGEDLDEVSARESMKKAEEKLRESSAERPGLCPDESGAGRLCGTDSRH